MSINWRPRLRALNTAGDTIVEVLIVIIVISAVISSGYSIAVISLQSTQLAQERSAALKIAEGQLEDLKSLGSNNTALLNVINTAGLGASGFCLDDATMATYLAGNTVIPSSNKIVGGGPVIANPNEPFSNYPAACSKPGNGLSCGSSFCYYFGIRPLGGNNYTASVRWDGPRGTRQQLQMSYRVYP